MIMFFCVFSWRQIGRVTAAANTGRSASDTGSGRASEAEQSRKRLLRIATMVSVCLLIMVTALVTTASKLDEWSRTADISLRCGISETWSSHDWEAYGFRSSDDVAKVCNFEEKIDVSHDFGCLSGCWWYLEISTEHLVCDDPVGTMEWWTRAIADGTSGSVRPLCDCPCNNLIEVERPRWYNPVCFNPRLKKHKTPPLISNAKVSGFWP
jgi:hypothetical protein